MLTTTERAVDFWSDRTKREFDDAIEAEAERAELVAAIAKEKLDAKLAAVPIVDLMDGVHAIDEMDCGVLRAAWRVSDEALGRHFRKFVTRQMAASAELEAEQKADEA
ncbi:hypothetical protein [Burkholderia cenocepacia]|uniref:hypothetical protein n=1 Tax=Burkholderia cenocepacia TaxID=95486 RepID=UPI00201977B4|nr:hypothetical protein [Burkholderia cenocepacia]MCO1396389.1 hypothetical protein [Burkholderia cenocepacia]MCO1408963.1 hypothetical protein [Burkholderia cenocepacia]UQN92062.1 hypothetical protein L0Z06_15180 [Burkholderia cenocepacia]UQN99211.1 hypothetical protein L0Z39_16970 [Burkholderia cenocepacia]UQP50834.1 hypothetical protein L0Y99_10275 [Burkholderia cenocepacia]